MMDKVVKLVIVEEIMMVGRREFEDKGMVEIVGDVELMIEFMGGEMLGRVG